MLILQQHRDQHQRYSSTGAALRPHRTSPVLPGEDRDLSTLLGRGLPTAVLWPPGPPLLTAGRPPPPSQSRVFLRAAPGLCGALRCSGPPVAELWAERRAPLSSAPCSEATRRAAARGLSLYARGGGAAAAPRGIKEPPHFVRRRSALGAGPGGGRGRGLVSARAVPALVTCACAVLPLALPQAQPWRRRRWRCS